MLNFVLCDDIPNITNKLSCMLESIFIENSFDASIGLKASSAEEVLEYTKNNKVDVLLLDINLKSTISGLDLAEEIRKYNKNAYIIFTTGHAEYVFLSFRVKTFDYIQKPIVKERLEDTIKRLFNDMSYTPKKYIKLNNKNTFINQDDIYYIKRDGMKLVFHTKNKSYETYSSFNKIESCLADNFVRCHKSYIANVNLIKNVEISSNTVQFDDKSYCSIGPKYKSNFMEVLKFEK